MEASADIFTHSGSLGRPFLGSVVLHGALFALALFGYLLPSGRGQNWGGTSSGGGAISATLVSGIPMPAPATPPQNVLANESKGLAQSPPKETPKEEPKAIPIPARDAKKKGEHETVQKRIPPKQVAKVDENQIPYGEGGPVAAPYGSFTAGGVRGAFNFTSGGDFGSRYAWYVDGMRRKITDAWSQVNPNINSDRKVYLYFEITRSGAPSNIRVEQSSGIPALDVSAVRALQRIDTFGPLPADYNGRYVAVEYYFDYHR